MWGLTVNGVDLYHIINWLIIYSFLGWLWETSFVSLKQGRFVNRGFIVGPFCTIYGCGAVMVYLILLPIQNNLLYLYIGGIIVPTILEYFTAVLMESIFHTSWWDYSDKKFNFQGRICLSASLGWGIFTVALFRVLHPVVCDFVALYTVFQGEVACIVIGCGYVCDFCYSAAVAFRLRDRIPELEAALERKQVELMLAMNEKLNSLEFAKDSIGALKDKIDVKDILENKNLLHSVNEKRKVLTQDLMADMENYRNKLFGTLDFGSARLLKAYPHFNRGHKFLQDKLNKGNKH